MQDIDKIVKAYDDYNNIEKFARVVDIKEIKENEFNLNVRRYIDSAEAEEIIDIKKVLVELEGMEEEREKIDKKVKNYIKELKY